MSYLIYLVLGVFTGLLSGIFGIGGGLIIVPTLLACFKFLGFPQEYVMHISVGTSLAIILVTVSNSTYGHHLNKNVDWSISKLMMLPIVIGAVVGSMVSKNLETKTLEIIFSAYVILVCIKMFTEVKMEREVRSKNNFLYRMVGFIIGFKSIILGIGGGTISIPFLTWRGHSMKNAVGISASLGIIIAISGAATYIYNGLGITELPEYSLGFVYLPAFLGVILTSFYFARVGAIISHRLPQKHLKFIFAIFLLIVAAKMVYNNV